MVVSEDIVTRKFSGMSYEEVLEYLVQEVKDRNYLITRINNIDNIHYRKNGDFTKNLKFKLYKIVEFCNLENCSQLISTDLTAGVFMPVKFAIYQTDNYEQVLISFLKPTAFARIFNSERMMRIAELLEKDMYEILDEIIF